MEILIINKGQKMKLSFILLSALSMASCKKFLDIPPPKTELVTASVFGNSATATSAQTNIYTQMFTQIMSFRMAQYMGMYSDELTNYDTRDVTQIQIYTNALEAVNNPGPWANAYNYIYQANAVINGLQTTPGCSAAVKQQLTGEALFVRAFWHFYLTNIYGDVPLVLTPDYTINKSISRSPRVQVLSQVVADLQQAKGLLNDNYVDGSDTLTTTERVRPNKAAALALMARAYLYLGDYDHQNAADYVKADSAATAVIGNTNYSLPSLNAVFLANSSEAIWQLQTTSPPPPEDTYDGKEFILLGAPANSSVNSNTISPQLMNAFEPGDQRLTNWIGSITKGANTYYFPYKYKQHTYTGNEYTMVLRLGEQYLIRAEARVREGNLSGAISDLNTIRSRAGLPNTTAATNTDLLTAILHERQVELFTEWGARWFDLCRTGNALAVMSVVCPQKNGSWNSNNYQLLFPVPQSDILNDINLKQNPGY